jgi:hypothetical protein
MLTHSRLTFIREIIITHPGPNNRVYNKRLGLYKCECGNIIECNQRMVDTGFKKSCGCLISKHHNRTTHGLGNDHPLYSVWCNMKSRCYNPKNEKFQRYGGRGVKVCDEWLHDFAAFYKWAIGMGWKEGLQIDKDIKGNGLLYSPENCIITNNKTNANKRRHTRLVTRNGTTKSIMQWCEHYGLNQSTFYSRINTGWSFENALTTPKRPDNRKYLLKT